MTKKRLLLSLLLGGLIYAETPEASPGKVRVFVYPAPTTWGYSFKVYADQTLIAKFRSKKYYFSTDLEPGRHFFYAGPDTKHGVTVELTATRQYFLECDDNSAAHAKVWLGRSTIACTLVDPDQGKSDIEKLKPSPAPASAPLKELR